MLRSSGISQTGGKDVFGRLNIEKIVTQGDPKKLVKAVKKDASGVISAIKRQKNWDALNKLLDREPGIVIDQVIRKGDVDLLKRIVDGQPRFLRTYFTHSNYAEAGLLHIAAVHNKPAVIDFLVNEKDVSVNKLQENLWTPLHFAAQNASLEAMQKLLDLGADPNIKLKEKTLYDLCIGIDTKELLQSFTKKQEKPEATAKAENGWKSSAPDEVVHEHKLDRYLLTDIFNFAAKTWTRITENLSNGQTTPETKTFKEAAPELIAQARAELDRITGAAPVTLKKAGPSYTAIENARL
jgi:hypothetical protein